MKDITLHILGILLGLLAMWLIIANDTPKTCARSYCAGTCYEFLGCPGDGCFCAIQSGEVEGYCVPLPDDDEEDYNLLGSTL